MTRLHAEFCREALTVGVCGPKTGKVLRV